MATEAQRRANRKYDAKNVKVYTLKVNKNTDTDIYNHLLDIQNMNQYLKSLVKKDVKGE